MKKTLLQLFLFIIITAVLTSQTVLALPVAFPGAEGYGAYAEGGRGGDVYYVTNTNDSGAGSLRYGINTASGPRTIVFSVSGVIELDDPLLIEEDYITIAGQTAPGDGICLRDECFTIDAKHVIIRFIRSRLGDGGAEADSISITGGNNIIMDHCSASWSVDETFSCSDDAGQVTVQWSVISEALEDSIHSKGLHSYLALIRGRTGKAVSYHHNLFAHARSRMPRPGNYDENDYISDPDGFLFDFRNNVLYNWDGGNPSYNGDTDSITRMNYVGNYCKAGPNGSYGNIHDVGSKHNMGYFEGNYFDGEIPEDQYSLVDFDDWSGGEIDSWIQTSPLTSTKGYANVFVPQTAQDAYADVLDYAGQPLTSS